MKRLGRLILMLLAAGAGSVLTTPAMARSLTADQLMNAGFICAVAGPHDWMHCFNGQLLTKGRAPIPVLVFTNDGSIFLGTEQLIHEDQYAGQPCPQDGLDQWEYVGSIPYYACHHFATSD